jgi:hypothetical protein
MAVINVSAGAGDCWGYPSNIYTTTDYMIIGVTSRVWVPFVVNITKNTLINSALIKFRATQNRATTTVKAIFGCEAADNPSAPSTWASLSSRAITSAYLTNNNVGSWTLGSEYTFDITSSVQEIINRSGWSSGNTLAVLIIDNGTSAGAERIAAPVENTSYTEPILTIDYVTTSVKSVGGVAQASVKKISSVAIASVKKIGGVA